MKTTTIFVLLFLALHQLCMADELDAPSSPDKRYRITEKLSAIHPTLQEASETATLYYGDLICWKYESIARGFCFSWAPDSSGFLFGITHITGSMTLYYVHIEDGVDVYPISVDLDTIANIVSAHLQDRKGADAPKSGVEWDTIKWTTPHTCRMLFFQRFLGQNADSLLELELNPAPPHTGLATRLPLPPAYPLAPTLKILSTTQKK